MNKRELRLDKYGISKKRFKELCGFCEQYPEWKLRISSGMTISGTSCSPTPRSVTNNVHKPTEDTAIKLDRYIANCNLIESIAKKADNANWRHLINGICGGRSVTWLIAVDNMPLSKSAYYERRKYFFYLLDKEKS